MSVVDGYVPKSVSSFVVSVVAVDGSATTSVPSVEVSSDGTSTVVTSGASVGASVVGVVSVTIFNSGCTSEVFSFTIFPPIYKI